MSTLEGPAAVACVGGTMLALLLNTGLIQLYRAVLLRRARALRAPFHGDYSTPEDQALDLELKALEQYAHGLSFQVGMLLASAIATAVLYAGLWYELLFDPEPATIEPAIFFWFALIDGSMMLGATVSAVKEHPPL